MNTAVSSAMRVTHKPTRLAPGDTVGIISPSWGGAGMFPHRVALGREQLERMGYLFKMGEFAAGQSGWVSASPEQRAADIHAMLLDPAVKAIIAAIAGDHSNQLLPLLDFDLFQRFPKIFMGFSDVTVLNIAIWKMTGLVTFNGPALLTDFAEFPHMLAYTRSSFENTVCRPEPVGRIEPSPLWTEEFLAWGTKAYLERPRAMQPSGGWKWLKPGSAEGILLGGCLESLDHLRGTAFWPTEQHWRDAILFIETSEEAPAPARVDSILADYENMGVLGWIRGLLVGRPMGYSPEDKLLLQQVLLERTQKYTFPIIAEMDFGHTSPQFTLPLGCRAGIDGEHRQFSILENAVV